MFSLDRVEDNLRSEEFSQLVQELKTAEQTLEAFYSTYGCAEVSWKQAPHRVSEDFRGRVRISDCNVWQEVRYQLESLIYRLAHEFEGQLEKFSYQEGTICSAEDSVILKAKLESLAKIERYFLANVEVLLRVYLFEAVADKRQTFAPTIEPTKSLLLQREILENRVDNARKAVLAFRVNLLNELETRVRDVLGADVKIEWLDDWHNVPSHNGVYLLCQGGSLEYIGESDNLRQRITPAGHHIYEHPGHLIGIIRTEPGNTRTRKDMERLLIRALHPPLNVVGRTKDDSAEVTVYETTMVSAL